MKNIDIYDLGTGETHVTEVFKTKAEIQVFVNANPEYGKGVE